MKKKNPPDFSAARYHDIKRTWRKLKPLFTSKEAENIWRPCLEEWKQWKMEEHNIEYTKRAPGDEQYERFPADFDGCDWRCDVKGRPAEFLNFVCHGACHWVADLALFVAASSMPQIPWRIHTAVKHTTVWNGDITNPVLFDINYYGMKCAEPDETLETVYTGRMLPPGEFLKQYLHHTPHFPTLNKGATQ